MALFDPNHPFFEPLWRRVAVVGVCFAWGTVEFAMNAPMWGVVFCGIGAVAGHQFFMARRPTPDGKDHQNQ